PGARIAGEEALEIAGDAVVIAEQEPGYVVDDVMEPRHDQHAVEHAVGEQAERPGVQHRATEHIHALLEVLPLGAERARQQQSREATRNRHEAPPAEEGEVTRQTDVEEAVVERSGGQTREDARRHTELGELVRLVRRDRSEEHTSELQSLAYLVCRLLLEKKKRT